MGGKLPDMEFPVPVVGVITICFLFALEFFDF